MEAIGDLRFLLAEVVKSAGRLAPVAGEMGDTPMKVSGLMIALLLSSLQSLTALAVAQGASLKPSGATPRPVIELRGGHLTVQLQQAPWAVVLPELERQTGVRIVPRGPLTGTLTQSLDAVPLEEGLRRLFREVNTIFLYTKVEPEAPAADALVRVWLLPKDAGAAQGRSLHPPSSGEAAQEPPSFAAIVAEAPSPAEAPTLEGELVAEETQEARLAALHAAAWQGQTAALQQALLDPDQTLQATAVELLAERDPPGTVALLVETSKSGPPEQRLQALQFLTTQADEPTVLSTLVQALNDADASVKSYAVQALAERGGPHALGPLRQALRDTDPAVRLQVIEHVAPHDEGHTLLQEALADEDATVRDLAAFWLEQAISEGR